MLRKILKITAISVGSIIGIAAVYLLTERILSRITVDETTNQEEKNITMYVMSNGVHTDLVLPTRNSIIDWSELFPYENTLGKEHDFKYIAIGWGDKGFYLNTPEWKDLKASTAFVAATGIGETALHITYHNQIQLDSETKKINITETQYKSLVTYIKESIEYDSNAKTQLIATKAQYGNNDAFYEAKGAYSVAFTCNTWTNDALKASGIKASKWVAFDKGIIYQHTENE